MSDDTSNIVTGWEPSRLTFAPPLEFFMSEFRDGEERIIYTIKDGKLELGEGVAPEEVAQAIHREWQRLTGEAG